MDPNPAQQELIESLDGIRLVDAGAGTGKTFALSRRYAHLLASRDVTPDDILLVTFTRNGAEEMKERIVNTADHDRAALREAPIQTFHSLCKEIVDEYGVDAPRHLGIEETIGPATGILESAVREQQSFERFYDTFKEEHPEHEAFYPVVWNPADLLDLLKSLAAKGIFPTREGWYRDGEDHLDGDRDAFMERFEEANTSDGGSQSDLRSALNALRYKTLPDDAPDPAAIRGPRGTKQIDREWAEEAFDADRSALKAFIHDLYHEYIAFALRRNELNFAFVQMFAYVLLIEDDDLRDRYGFAYVMVDEFQDTSEIQFKLTLLFADTDNLCVVGDWKQSIYSFQYASVDNIRRFAERLHRYREELNRDRRRVPYPVDTVERIELTTNYRSTQPILDLAEETLTLPATQREDVDREAVRDAVTQLDATNTGGTTIAAHAAREEHDLVLDRIQHLVDNPDYTVPDDEDGERRLEYGDIAVFSRDRAFGLTLQDRAEEYDIPVAFEGGIDLFTTEPALLLLAWLRVLHDRDARRGWAVILERAGYTLDETRSILNDQAYPVEMRQFREHLAGKEDIGAIAASVFHRYGFDSPIADAVIAVLRDTFEGSYMNHGDIIRFIEDTIEHGETYEVDTGTEEDMVTVQTIHAAKGLQYPAVILTNLNDRAFPGTRGGSAAIAYEDPIGLFARKTFEDGDLPYVYDDWKATLMTKCLTGDYDEERRLYYVALTRAENHLLLTAEDGEESPFFTGIPVEPEPIDPAPRAEEHAPRQASYLPVTPVDTQTPVTRPVTSLEPQTEREGWKDDAGRGVEIGQQVHRFAERYAIGEAVTPSNPDEEHVAAFLDGLDGALKPEQSCLLPLDTEERSVVLRGSIDLLHVTDDAVQVIDFKTDTDLDVSRYRPQISAYLYAVRDAYPDRTVSAVVFHTRTGKRHPVEPCPREELATLL